MKNTLSLLLALVVLASLCGCGSPPSPASSNISQPAPAASSGIIPAADISPSPLLGIKKITYHIPPPVFPLINQQRFIEFYPDASARITSCPAWQDDTDITTPQAAAQLGYMPQVFYIPQTCFDALEQALYETRFLSLPPNLDKEFDTFITDVSPSTLTVETTTQTHSCYTAAWPAQLDAVRTALNDALEQGFVEDTRVGDLSTSDAEILYTHVYYNLEDYQVFAYDMLLRGDGSATISNYGPFALPLLEVGHNFARSKSLLVHEYEREMDLALFNRLLRLLEQHDFASLPDEFPASIDDELHYLTNSNSIHYITATVGGAKHTISFMGTPSLYAIAPFDEIYDALQAALYSEPQPVPPTMQELLAWEH